MSQLIKTITQLKQRDNFEIDYSMRMMDKLHAQVQDFKRLQRLDEQYKDELFTTGGQTQNFKSIINNLNEYEKLKIEEQREDESQIELSRYSGLNYDLSMILMNLSYHSDNERKMIREVSRHISQNERDVLLQLLNNTASVIQRKTAMKILNRIIEPPSLVQFVENETQTDRVIDQSKDLIEKIKEQALALEQLDKKHNHMSDNYEHSKKKIKTLTDELNATKAELKTQHKITDDLETELKRFDIVVVKTKVTDLNE